MKSKTSFFRVSPAVIKEDFRRFWAVPVFAFIGYFLFAILPILSRYSQIKKDGGSSANIMDVGSVVDGLLAGQNPFVIINSLWVPLLAGLLIFSYLHRTGSVMSVHSQPFTRNTLFNSHFISCLSFCILPILLTGIILLVIAQPIYDPNGGVNADVNLFARSRILLWMWDYCLTSFFVLAIVVFGGMITGTSVHHFIAAVGFNIVIPAIYLILKMYYTMYLFGYNVSSYSVLEYLSPILKSFAHDPIGLKWSLIYLIITAVIIGLSMFLYNRRRLERATDGVVFGIANVLITLLFGFLGMSLLGFVFAAVFQASQGLVIFGYVCGALLAMIIVRMVILKTIRVFDKQLLKMIAAYAAAAAIFFAVIVFDLTGYENRVPDPQEIGSVKIMNDAASYTYQEQTPDGYLTFSDPETIALVTEFHREITENKEICKTYTDGKWDEGYPVTISYFTGKQGSDDCELKMTRSYRIPLSLLTESEAWIALEDSAEIKEIRSQSMPETAAGETKVLACSITPSDIHWSSSDTAYSINLSTAEAEEFYEIFRQEILSYSGKERVQRDLQNDFASVSVSFNMQKQADSSSQVKNVDFSLKWTDEDSLAWLQQKGYLTALEENTAGIWGSVVLETPVIDRSDTDYPDLFPRDEEEMMTIPAADEKTVVITDQKQILSLMRKMLNYRVNSLIDENNISDYCCVTLYPKSLNSDDYGEYTFAFIRRADIPEGIAAPAQ